MVISTQKFLQSSGSKNLNLLSGISLSRMQLSKKEQELNARSRKITSENMQMMTEMFSTQNQSAAFYERGYIEGYRKAFTEGFKYAQKQYEPRENLLTGILKNLKQREGGGYLNKGDVSLVGERGPELMVAKQDVNIVANRDIKFIPPSLKSKTPTTTIVRTIIQKQGTKIVNRK